MTTELLETAHDENEWKPAESERIFAWRLLSLKQGGYDDNAAFVLAHVGHVDLHLAVDLVARGCSTQTAARILL
jgi:hypothetical protein